MDAEKFKEVRGRLIQEPVKCTTCKGGGKEFHGLFSRNCRSCGTTGFENLPSDIIATLDYVKTLETLLYYECLSCGKPGTKGKAEVLQDGVPLCPECLTEEES